MDDTSLINAIEQFQLGTLYEWRKAGGTKNSNYAVVADTGKWFLRKKHQDYCDEARIEFDFQAAKFWSRHRLPVQVPCITPQGKHFCLQANEMWEAFPYVEGSHLRDGNPDDCRALGQTLAALHGTGREFPHRFCKAAERGETDPQRLRIQCETLLLDCPQLAEPLAHYKKAIVTASKDLPNSVFTQLPATLIHGDLQPANILMADSSVAALVDLDWCMWMPRIYDIAYALLCCCAGHEDKFDGGDIWSLTQTPIFEGSASRAFLDAYRKGGCPLTNNERNALLPQLILSWCEMRIDGALKVSPEQRAEFLQRDPHEIETAIQKALA